MEFPIKSKLIINIDDPILADNIYRILIPEVKTTKSSKISIVKNNDNNVILYIEAKTIPGLRAILNSYLRWINSCLEVFSLKENISKTNKSRIAK
jgi:tRNA threonylcarbamoyladenosine modification (KEOPS) complex  Pcc1 subunit